MFESMTIAYQIIKLSNFLVYKVSILFKLLVAS
jgi:hypothetical protein